MTNTADYQCLNQRARELSERLAIVQDRIHRNEELTKKIVAAQGVIDKFMPAVKTYLS